MYQINEEFTILHVAQRLKINQKEVAELLRGSLVIEKGTEMEKLFMSMVREVKSDQPLATNYVHEEVIRPKPNAYIMARVKTGYEAYLNIVKTCFDGFQNQILTLSQQQGMTLKHVARKLFVTEDEVISEMAKITVYTKSSVFCILASQIFLRGMEFDENDLATLILHDPWIPWEKRNCMQFHMFMRLDLTPHPIDYDAITSLGSFESRQVALEGLEYASHKYDFAKDVLFLRKRPHLS